MKRILRHSSFFLVLLVFCLLAWLMVGCNNNRAENEDLSAIQEAGVLSGEKAEEKGDTLQGEKEQLREEKVYTFSNYPRNPKTPEDVFAAYLFLGESYLRGEIELDEFLKVFPTETREVSRKEILRTFQRVKPAGFEEVRILKVSEAYDGTVIVEGLLIFEIGKDTPYKDELIRENGEWKMNR